MKMSLPAELSSEVAATVAAWAEGGDVARLWGRDASLWTGAGEDEWLGWLDAPDRADLGVLTALRHDVRAGGFTHALLLGMGGSSLGPEMLAEIFGSRKDMPELVVLDSTDPAQVAAFESKVDLARTIFLVSSKSGSTLEPNIFMDHFMARAAETLGGDAAARFVAVTDPGSQLARRASAEGFRHIALGDPSIGGRYSVLSPFGMVPAAVMGLDVERLLGGAAVMARACSAVATDNPGVALGAVLGVCAKRGRDKLTVLTSPALRDLGAWLEQLLAESTGKGGRGIIPVDREPLGGPEDYGADRLFLHVRLASDADPDRDLGVSRLVEAGHPVVGIDLDDVYELGGELFRWEFATAVAGAVIGINPFDQPDVEASKVATRKLTDAYEKTGSLPPEEPFFSEGDISLFADDDNARAIASGVGASAGLSDHLHAHLGRISSGDYAALLAYIAMSPKHEGSLTRMRVGVRAATGAATCVGFGPRFLHSTGQAYKGGPNSGVFLQITCDDPNDIEVPGRSYTFGVVKAAQARGDFEVLAERGRRALRVHLGPDVSAGLATLEDALRSAP